MSARSGQPSRRSSGPNPSRCRCRRRSTPARHSRSRSRQCHPASRRRRIEEAGDWQSAIRSAIRQDRGRRHEPELGDVVVNALRMLAIVRVGGRDAGKHALEATRREAGSGLRASSCRNLSEGRHETGRSECQRHDPEVSLRLGFAPFGDDFGGGGRDGFSGHLSIPTVSQRSDSFTAGRKPASPGKTPEIGVSAQPRR